jgi:hypothetical protein
MDSTESVHPQFVSILDAREPEETAFDKSDSTSDSKEEASENPTVAREARISKVTTEDPDNRRRTLLEAVHVCSKLKRSSTVIESIAAATAGKIPDEVISDSLSAVNDKETEMSTSSADVGEKNGEGVGAVVVGGTTQMVGTDDGFNDGWNDGPIVGW